MIHDIPSHQRFLLGNNLLLSLTTNASPSTSKGSLVSATDATGGSIPDPVISGHVDKYLRVAGITDQQGISVKLLVEGLTYPLYCVRSANKWTVCKKINTKASSVTTKLNPEIGDDFVVKDNLLEQLAYHNFDKKEMRAFVEAFVGKTVKALDVYYDKDNGTKSWWVTVDLCCEVPIVCCELIKEQ